MIDRRELFDRTRALWPHAVLLGPRDSASEDEPIWEIIQVHDGIEENVSDDDEWLNLAVWAFHQVLWELAIGHLEAGQRVLKPSSVTFEQFDRCIRKNLADQSWASIRSEYDSSLA